MKRAMIVVAAMALGGVLLPGCAARETKWSGETASMVVYAKSIPLYPGSKAKDAMGSDSYGDTEDSHTEGMCVWFEVKDFRKEQVLDWYEVRLPNAKTEPLESGGIQLTVPVPNGEPGEDMGVVIDDKGYRVFEHTKPGKHRNT